MGFGDIKTDPSVFGNTNLKPENTVEYVDKNTFSHRARELIKCRNDIVYFAETYFTIVNLDVGKQIIKLYPKQKQLLEMLRDNNRVVVLASRQSAKTTTYTIYALWLTIFHQDQKVLIAANKQDTSLEIMSRIRLAFEHLPMWLKCGIKVWNKGQVIFSNDSSIEGVATSSSSARGKSVNCISGKTMVTILEKNKLYTLSINELYNREKKYWFFNPNNNIKVLTTDGFLQYKFINKTKNKVKMNKISLESGKNITCTLDHEIFINEKEKKKCSDLKINNLIMTIDGLEKIQSIESVEPDFAFDIVDVKKIKSFYGNNINVSNCLFIDEAAIIPQNIMDEFYNAIYPIVSSSKKSKVVMVSTPKGIGNLFYKTYETARLGVSEDGWKSFRMDWWDVPGRDEDWHKKTLASLNYDETAFGQEFGNCVEHKTLVNIYDNKTGKTKKISIGMLYVLLRHTRKKNKHIKRKIRRL